MRQRYLDAVRRELGLPETCRLRAALHNLLVYEPGQFFVAHQDSEKADDMIGTPVAIFPSAFTGGEMVIEHHDQQMTFTGARGKIALIAFCADCYHQVRRVRQRCTIIVRYGWLPILGSRLERPPRRPYPHALPN